MKVYTRSTVAITVLAMCLALAGTAAAKGKKYGLFVGINNYPAPTNTLYGAVNDAMNMKSLLETKFAFSPANDVILTDQQATRAAILSNLASLGARAGAGVGVVPPRALIFFLVGASGLVVQLAVVSLCRDLGLTFMASQVTAALTAMTSNFLINNMVTYRDRRLRGVKLLTGYLRFCGLCGVGMIANVAVANLVHQHTPMWLVASAAGAFAGAAWNYVSTSLAVW